MVDLERRPDDRDLLASIFRTIHTIKGTCGFFGYRRLEAIAHIAENILNELRNGTRDLDTPLASLMLAAVDAIKKILASIKANQTEGARDSLGELCNVLAGNLKPLLPPGVGLSTPSVVKGADYSLRVFGDTLCECLHFADSGDDFRVTLIIG